MIWQFYEWKKVNAKKKYDFFSQGMRCLVVINSFIMHIIC